MLDAKERRVLNLARAGADEPEPSWKQPLFSWVFVIGGLAFGVWDVIDGIRPGATAGFMVGIGLGFLLMAGPLSRHLWLAYRLIRRADDAGIFEPAGETERESG